MNKFCTKCGAQLGEGAKFCVHCGEPVNSENRVPVNVDSPPNHNQDIATQGYSSSEEFSIDKALQWVRKNYKLVGTVLIICVSLLIMMPSSDVSTVKNGTFAFNQSVKVGPAFDKFFGDTNWESKEINGKHFVYFTGKCTDMQDGSEQLCKISFEVYPKNKTFRVVKVQMDGNDVTGVSNQMLKEIVAGNKTIHYGL